MLPGLLAPRDNYALDGVRPGDSLLRARAKLRLGKPFVVGANTWYLASGAAATGVLKVRAGIVYEIGIASKAFTTGSRARRFFTG